MSHPKLLKAPARVLLLTFVVSAGVAVTPPASTPQMVPVSGHGPGHATGTRLRVRQLLEEMDDYVLRHGVPHGGINE
jgi:hypothetical protein